MEPTAAALPSQPGSSGPSPARRVLRALVLLAPLLAGCAAVPQAPAAPGDLTVRAYWIDPQARMIRLVGGVHCVLERTGGPRTRLEQITEAGRPIRFEDLPAGTYRLTVSSPVFPEAGGDVELEPGAHRTVWVNVQGAIRRADAAAAAQAAPAPLTVVEGDVRYVVETPRTIVLKLLQPDEQDYLETLLHYQGEGGQRADYPSLEELGEPTFDRGGPR